ncbi:hypothetical protein RvY_15473 [Ramazzottius varieornatus]|uniref:Activator of basal transcription 1 n=1 Tax=Ramazzottius varieornatus TaxID=947166 RepID=A0A1D1VW97_RAMVA|nr:hypothetical protein RvY_15473 [Ramazzottius varieornatus]
MDGRDRESDMDAEHQKGETDTESSSLVPDDEDGSGASEDNTQEGGSEEDEDGADEYDYLSEGEGDSDDDSALISASRKNKLRDAALNVESRVKKSGVVYLSTIPPGMNVAKLREIMSEYGKIGRLYLEPDLKGAVQSRRKNNDSIKHNRKYLEGWVEFVSKRTAKQVAESLNNKEVGGKRRTPYHGSLWNIKYLHRFKWNHLTERLAHEKMTRQHRIRQEIAQAKRQSNFFNKNVEKSKILDKMQARKAEEGKPFAPLKTFEVSQRLTDEEYTKAKAKKATKRLAGTGRHSGSGLSSAILAKLFPPKT